MPFKVNKFSCKADHNIGVSFASSGIVTLPIYDSGTNHWSVRDRGQCLFFWDCPGCFGTVGYEWVHWVWLASCLASSTNTTYWRQATHLAILVIWFVDIVSVILPMFMIVNIYLHGTNHMTALECAMCQMLTTVWFSWSGKSYQTFYNSLYSFY